MDEDKPNRDQVEGRTDKAAGEIKETVGQATGDKGLEREGAREKAGGEAQQDRGDAHQETVHDVAEEVAEKIVDDVEQLREEVKKS